MQVEKLLGVIKGDVVAEEKWEGLKKKKKKKKKLYDCFKTLFS